MVDETHRSEAILPGTRLALTTRQRLVRGVFRFLRTKPLGTVGAVIVLAMIFMAVFAPWLAPHDPNFFESALRLQAPSQVHPLGTDEFGRDLLSRIIYGARISWYVSLGAIVLGPMIGGLLGVISGYLGGKLDLALQRIMDIMMSFPNLILALAIVAVLGPSLNNVIIAIAIPSLPRAGRILRSAAISVRERQYVEAARAIGAQQGRIIFRHVLPNCTAPWIIILSIDLGAFILAEASLSFLGLGLPPPTPSWGGMLSGAGRQFVERAPWMAIYPGLALSLAVFGFNLLGDALRDVLDPRLRRG